VPKEILWNNEDSQTKSQESERTEIKKGWMVFAYHACPGFREIKKSTEDSEEEAPGGAFEVMVTTPLRN
jgi:hypothetical protein